MVFVIDTDGIRFLHTDLIPVAELGTITVTRVSEVEFNHATQKWEVLQVGSGPVLFSHLERSECLKWEKREFNERLENYGSLNL